jgi:hypothetical protein
MLETNWIFLVYQSTITFLKTSKVLPKFLLILHTLVFWEKEKDGLPLVPLLVHANSCSQPTYYYCWRWGGSLCDSEERIRAQKQDYVRML